MKMKKKSLTLTLVPIINLMTETCRSKTVIISLRGTDVLLIVVPGNAINGDKDPLIYQLPIIPHLKFNMWYYIIPGCEIVGFAGV